MLPGLYNLSITYSDFGRNSWEKFINWDDDGPNDHELSQWQNFGAAIEINLRRPYLARYSDDFLKYCSRNGFDPTYHHMPLGNLPDIETMTLAREVMQRNVYQTGNYLIFEQCV